MKKLNIGIIGLGTIGKLHLHNCLKIKNIKLNAVADLSTKSLRLAKSLGVKNVYKDYNELLKNSELDAVIIALPQHLHLKSVVSSAENHKHVLLEKPLARNTTEGKEIVRVVRKHGIEAMVGYPLRFSKQFRIPRLKMLNGELGDVEIAYATNISTGPFVHRIDTGAPKPVPNWWWNKDLVGGGALLDLGSHMIDLVRWYFGKVIAAKSQLGYRFGLEQDDHAICQLKFKNGQNVIISVGWFSQKSQITLNLHGTAGHLTADYYRTLKKSETILQTLNRRPPFFDLPYLDEIKHFAYCIKKDKQPEPSCESALRDLEIIEEAYLNQIF